MNNTGISHFILGVRRGWVRIDANACCAKHTLSANVGTKTFHNTLHSNWSFLLLSRNIQHRIFCIIMRISILYSRHHTVGIMHSYRVNYISTRIYHFTICIVCMIYDIFMYVYIYILYEHVCRHIYQYMYIGYDRLTLGTGGFPGIHMVGWGGG